MLLTKALIDALLPPGPLWIPQEGEGFDDLLTGIAECKETIRADLHHLAHVRNPLLTNLLDDLEREFGVTPVTGSDESTRRARLAGVKAATNGDGSDTFLQSVLDTAGFNVQVHLNNPPVDPAQFILYTPSAIFGNAAAQFGRSSMGAQAGELLVNGPVYRNQVKVKYKIPTDPGYWPQFFFVGGAATRNGAGELTDIEDAGVPIGRKGELFNLILRCKPMHAWAGLRLKYV